MSPFYTRTGDDGKTGLLGKGRIEKYHPRMEALGDTDEASAALGVARSVAKAVQTPAILVDVQKDLYLLMAELAVSNEEAPRFQKLEQKRLEWLESTIEVLTELVTVPGGFILPGDSPGGAALSLARTIVRRAERRVAALLDNGDIENPLLVQYMNRLSSLCFILELLENQQAGHQTTLARK